jgi:hypothetical protein
LSGVLWLVVSDSQSELVSTNVLVPVEGSESCQSRFDLESDSVWILGLWPVVGLLINVPGLVNTIAAVPEGNVSPMLVLCTVDGQTFSTEVSNGSVDQEETLETSVENV